MPKSAFMVSMTFWGPPLLEALIFASPWPGTFTQRSRGNDTTSACFWAGSTRTTHIVSERLSSAWVSAPRTRKLSGPEVTAAVWTLTRLAAASLTSMT